MPRIPEHSAHEPPRTLEPGSVTDCKQQPLTGRDSMARRGPLIVERVVDRLSGASCAFCAFRAFGCAFSAGSALRAGRRGHGKEKVYGSIP